MVEMLAKLQASQYENHGMLELLLKMKADQQVLAGTNQTKLGNNQAEIRSTICAFRSELKETIQHGIKAAVQPKRAVLDETNTCGEETEAEPDPIMMPSAEERQNIPKADTAVVPVRGLRKQHRVQHLASERRQKMGERTQGNGGSQRKFVAARRGMTHRAKWHGSRDVSFRDKAKTMLHRKPRRDGSSRRNIGMAPNAKFGLKDPST
jgi:hypothetical protein